MISPTPGLIAQMSGKPTQKRYMCATIYVDQATDYTYMHMQQSMDAKETIHGKQAFERHIARMGHKVMYYHADNSIFASTEWRASCGDLDQQLTFAGVGAHHMNGVAEAKIKTLKNLAQTMMIHSKQRWPQAITTNLWPYTVRIEADTLNSTPSSRLRHGDTPMEAMGNTNVHTNVKHWHPFGCPMYPLKASLQSGTIHHKWEPQARLGIHLGRSPQHARLVALVLNVETELVSPQFHIKMD